MTREEAIKWLKDHHSIDLNTQDDEAHRMAIQALEQAPKTGHWVRWYETIEREHCTIHDPRCKCSECNYEYDPYIASLFNYCPNCGAKMESEE